jgi:N-acetylneuraminate synthase/N,N'-diacetyllegionaminate synthase
MNKVLIIAEAGVNHNGSLDLALKLVDAAAAAGADVVKFQTFKAQQLASTSAKKASYQQDNDPSEDNTQLAMLSKLELPLEWHYTLKKHAEAQGITFASTAFDIDSLNFLAELGLPFFKIPSGEITNRPLIEHIAKLGKEVILSTGMATVSEIKEAIDVLLEGGISRTQITVLHCNTEYPTPMEDVNLHAMLAIQKELNVQVGYSDHTLGIEVPIAAVAIGARVIEKHFTLDQTMTGPDHKASLEPAALKQMVQAIRNIELAISGTGEKAPSPSEIKNIAVARKSICYASDMMPNDIISEAHLIMLRPGTGVSPMEYRQLIGKKLNRPVRKGDLFDWTDII